MPFIGEYIRKQDLVSECRLARGTGSEHLFIFTTVYGFILSLLQMFRKNVSFLTLLPQCNLIGTWFMLLGIVQVYCISLCLGHPSYFYVAPQNISLFPLTSIPLSQEVTIVVNYFTTHLQCPTVQLRYTNLYKKVFILMPVLGI